MQLSELRYGEYFLLFGETTPIYQKLDNRVSDCVTYGGQHMFPPDLEVQRFNWGQEKQISPILATLLSVICFFICVSWTMLSAMLGRRVVMRPPSTRNLIKG